MNHVRAAIDIEVPVELAWAIITEFEQWPLWGPTVRRVAVDEPRVAAGITGKVQTAVGVWLPFEITEVDPGRAWSWKVAGIPATGHAVSPTGRSSCRLEFSVPWPAAPYVAVLRIGLRRVKYLAETAADPAG